jgi:hypothetical protein
MAGGISPVNLSPPVISGIGLVGETLSSTLGTWSGTSPISYSYQWKRNGSPILGAISSTYLLVAADADTNITCTVTATNTVGSMSSNSNSISVIGYDPSAYAFFQATGITDPAIKDAVDILVTDLKGYGIWDKMKAIYPFVGGTPTTHKFNLKDSRDLDAAFRLAFSGGWTHSSNGATPNKINGFANTFVIPSINLTNDSTHLSFYSRTNISSNEVDMGVKVDNPIRFNLEIRYNGNLSSDQYTYLTGRVNVANSNSSGYFVATRLNPSSHKVFRNSVQMGSTNTGASLGLSLLNLPIYLGTSNGSGAVYSSKQVAFSTIGDGLTDEDSANLYYSVQKFQTTLGRQVGTPIYSSNATDVNARLFLGATNIQDATITSAVDTLVQGLKTDGVWSKLKAVYPFVGGTATTHKFNLANALDEDTSFRLAFSGGWTHSSNGATPNGTNGYANTFFNPSVNSSLSSNSFGLYSRTSDTVGNKVMGVFNAAFTSAFQLNISAGTMFNGSALSLLSYTASPTTGLILATRTSTTLYKGFRNNVSLGSNSTLMTLLPNANFYLGARSDAGSPQLYNSYQHAFAFLGDGLTDTEASNLYTRVQAFQTTLNRQV